MNKFDVLIGRLATNAKNMVGARTCKPDSENGGWPYLDSPSCFIKPTTS
jgi:hypothetical protein